MKKVIIFTTFILFGVISLVTAEDGDGGYAGAYLQVPIGARPAAMGGAYISLSNDGAGVFYNPAGISNLRLKVISSSYRSMALDRTLGYFSFILPTQNNSAFGLNWLYASSGSVDARNSDGDKLGFDITQHSHSFSVIFAKRFEKFLSAGFKASYLHSSFAEMASYSVAFDIGCTFYISQLFSREERDLMAIQDIQVGFVVRNLAATYRWNNEKYFEQHTTGIFGSEQEDKIPVEIGLGSSARFFNKKLILATDFVKNQYQSFKLRSGAEYFFSPQFAVRGGLNAKHLSAGTGFVFKMGSKILAIDYAFSSDKVEAGSEHIFSFDLLF